MNEYKEVRRRWLNGESQRSIAKTLGISRNTVKKYCAGDAVPWERKTYQRSPSVLTPEAFVPLYFAPGDAIQIDWGEATRSEYKTV